MILSDVEEDVISTSYLERQHQLLGFRSGAGDAKGKLQLYSKYNA